MINIGDTIYGYHSNNNRGCYNGLPRYWEAYEVVGETKVSWLVGHVRNPIKVDKKTMKERKQDFTPIAFVESREQMERQVWITDNRYKISRMIESCTDYDKLKRIESILKEEQ